MRLADCGPRRASAVSACAASDGDDAFRRDLLVDGLSVEPDRDATPLAFVSTGATRTSAIRVVAMSRCGS